ncbi:hypothetical protein DF186_20920, partial [Enterococcus hirae]
PGATACTRPAPEHWRGKGRFPWAWADGRGGADDYRQASRFEPARARTTRARALAAPWARPIIADPLRCGPLPMRIAYEALTFD